MSDEVHDYEDELAFVNSRKIFAGKVKRGTKARKDREKAIRKAVDGRSLTATGRVIQFNFKCTPDVKALALEAAKEEGITIAEWLERLILDATTKGTK